eukprot:snap_masked-scaffold_2-processed-gene-15.16-mRNA-1 protein AED:1.00 eAED:1.00 QI:0/0/0/0/1/1/2/0/423
MEKSGFFMVLCFNIAMNSTNFLSMNYSLPNFSTTKTKEQVENLIKTSNHIEIESPFEEIHSDSTFSELEQEKEPDWTNCTNSENFLYHYTKSEPIYTEKNLKSIDQCRKDNLGLFTKNNLARNYLSNPKCVSARQTSPKFSFNLDIGKGKRFRCWSRTEENSHWYDSEQGGGLVVSFSMKLIYIPNMKVASQTFKHLMENNFNATIINQDSLRRELSRRGENIFMYTVFTFVRDPLTHFLSAYAEVDRRLSLTYGVSQKKVDEYFGKNSDTDFNFLSIPRKLEYEPNRALQTLSDIRKGYFLEKKEVEKNKYSVSHLYSQFWKTTRCLSKQRYPLNIDFIGRIENIQEDFDNLLTLIGHEQLSLKVTHNENHKARKHAKSIDLNTVKNKHLVKKLCEHYAVDFQCFHYDFPEFCNTKKSSTSS